MLVAACGVVAGYVVAGGDNPRALLAGAVLAALATGAGNVINDCFDLAIDRVNKPSRPLPSGRLSVRAARILYAVIAVAVLICAPLFLPPRVAALVVGWEVALFVYAWRCKRVLFAGNFLVALVSGSAFVCGAAIAGDARAALIPAGIAGAFVWCRELVKGGEDLEGDAASGVRTLAVRSGRTVAARVSGVGMLTLAVLIPLPALARVYSPVYFLVMGATVVPVLVLGALSLARHPEKPVFARVSRALKLGMFAGIAAIVLGA